MRPLSLENQDRLRGHQRDLYAAQGVNLDVSTLAELFAIEREINGRTPAERRAVRQERSKPLAGTLEAWLSS